MSSKVLAVTAVNSSYHASYDRAMTEIGASHYGALNGKIFAIIKSAFCKGSCIIGATSFNTACNDSKEDVGQDNILPSNTSLHKVI